MAQRWSLQYQRVFSNVHHILSSLLTSELVIDFERSGSIIYVDKMSRGSESDDCVTANGRVYIPEVRNEETPEVGMKFDSLDLVYNFYNRYAFLVGFSIRFHSSFWGKNKKEILRKKFVCCKQGAHRRDETRERKRQRGISRCNCKAKIVVVKTNGSKKGTQYKMTPSERMHLLRSHRHISDYTKVLTKQLGSVNIPIHQKVEGDGHDRFSRCFWADATSRREFKKAMPGGEPKTIITDQDAAMTRAISIAFPTTFHRLCIWHITSKFSVKLPHSAYKEYWREFHKDIWDTDNKDEFDAKWNIVVTKAGLTDHPWLSSMFDLRNLGFQPTHDNFLPLECQAAKERKYISRRNSSMNFIIRFERALSHQRQKELVADHVDAFEVAQCILPMLMSKQMATLYTRTMFQNRYDYFRKLDMTTSDPMQNSSYPDLDMVASYAMLPLFIICLGKKKYGIIVCDQP
ncbi:hypothetical protein Prudu_016869 [Prunus dulcis]|uniref:Protein FAR1-RELATED SEQUENCE n=1 Tax=Prunus dulcis TaxID=3755 RepID=A0A4Y1RNP6_PRUDU|nr:hypothetical protein Prudu_016869 [Prunus dulcis]